MPYTPTTWVEGVTTLGPTNLNKIETELARLKVNADLDPAAAIAYSKLALTGAILNADLAGSIAYAKLALTNSIVNADIAAGAAIAVSKLATGLAGPPGTELAYAEFTNAPSSTSTTFAGGTSVVSAGAVAFDGATKVRIEFYCPSLTTSANLAVVSLADGGAAGTDLGWLAISGSTTNISPCYGAREFTPPNATKTYSIILWQTAAGTAALTAGAGGAGVRLPGFIRISKV